MLEDFATQTATAGTSDKIAQLFDQYLNFIVTEPDLFSLGMQKEHTYWALNSAATSDAELDRVVDRIVSGLFSVVVTMGMLCMVLTTIQCAPANTWYCRGNTDYQMSERGGGGDGGSTTRSQAPRPHPQLER